MNSQPKTIALIKVGQIIEKIQEVQDIISPIDLIELEEDAHITLLYGLDLNYLPETERMISNSYPMMITIGEPLIFEKPEHDVLVYTVWSVELQRLFDRLSHLPNYNEYKRYLPHLTVAYIKKGRGKQYKSLNHLTGMVIEAYGASIIKPTGESTYIPFSLDSTGLTIKAKQPVETRLLSMAFDPKEYFEFLTIFSERRNIKAKQTDKQKLFISKEGVQRYLIYYKKLRNEVLSQSADLPQIISDNLTVISQVISPLVLGSPQAINRSIQLKMEAKMLPFDDRPAVEILRDTSNGKVAIKAVDLSIFVPKIDCDSKPDNEVTIYFNKPLGEHGGKIEIKSHGHNQKLTFDDGEIHGLNMTERQAVEAYQKYLEEFNLLTYEQFKRDVLPVSTFGKQGFLCRGNLHPFTIASVSFAQKSAWGYIGSYPSLYSQEQKIKQMIENALPIGTATFIENFLTSELYNIDLNPALKAKIYGSLHNLLLWQELESFGNPYFNISCNSLVHMHTVARLICEKSKITLDDMERFYLLLGCIAVWYESSLPNTDYSREASQIFQYIEREILDYLPDYWQGWLMGIKDVGNIHNLDTSLNWKENLLDSALTVAFYTRAFNQVVPKIWVYPQAINLLENYLENNIDFNTLKSHLEGFIRSSLESSIVKQQLMLAVERISPQKPSGIGMIGCHVENIYCHSEMGHITMYLSVTNAVNHLTCFADMGQSSLQLFLEKFGYTVPLIQFTGVDLLNDDSIVLCIITR